MNTLAKKDGLEILLHQHNLLLVSCGNIVFLKYCTGQVLAWISGLKVPLMPLGPSCPLQTILLSDLVGCGSLLQIVMAVGISFFTFKVCQQPLYSLQPHPTQHVQTLKSPGRGGCVGAE
jgi:hypothetical protein